jgi:flagellar hook-associated protein 3 FlgL
MIARVGTFSNASTLMAASMRVQVKLADQQAQEASSLKANTYGGLAGDTSQLLSLKSASARLTADGAAADSAGAYVQAAYTAVGSVTDLATTIKSQLSSIISVNGSDPTLTAQYATDWSKSLESLLNSQQGGVYLFSGQATDTAPANLSATGYDPASDPTTANTSYYQGSAQTRTFTASDGYSVNLSVPASSSGFEKIARALAMIAANPSDTATISSAFDLVGSATTDLGNTQAALSNQASDLDRLSTDNKTKVTTLGNLATNLSGADLTTAAVMVSQYQAQLEALYSTIGKLSSESLTKYL